jgi:hypothetical protein
MRLEDFDNAVEIFFLVAFHLVAAGSDCAGGGRF